MISNCLLVINKNVSLDHLLRCLYLENFTHLYFYFKPDILLKKKDIINDYFCKYQKNYPNTDFRLIPPGKIQNLCQSFKTIYTDNRDTIPKQILSSSNELIQIDCDEKNFIEKCLKLYDYPCVGGTFDRLHSGHKLLLTMSAVSTKSKIMIGLTSEELLEKKFLSQIIYSYHQREDAICDYLHSIGMLDSDFDIFPLKDMMGPSRDTPSLDSIIVSEETIKSCSIINQEREKLGYMPLSVVKVDFYFDENDKTSKIPHFEEVYAKVSSSNLRYNDLGKLLDKPSLTREKIENNIFSIGITGCIGSGKSSLVKKAQTMFSQLNCESFHMRTYDADSFAKSAYSKGTEAYHSVVNLFKSKCFDILTDDGSDIDHKKIARIVFSQKEMLNKLTEIVWPTTKADIQRKISNDFNELTKTHGSNVKLIALVEAAVLFEANWQSMFDEIWSCIIPKDEAIKRHTRRSNQLSKDDAKLRVSTQSENISKATMNKNGDQADWWSPCQLGSTFGPISMSNRVFSTQWSHDATNLQVEKALKDVINRNRF